jgi:hypothetical protein
MVLIGITGVLSPLRPHLKFPERENHSRSPLTFAVVPPLFEAEVIVNVHSRTIDNAGPSSSREARGPVWANVIQLLIWLAAGAVAFIPFAFDTSPLDAVMLHVPGNQGNWWHFLAGAPFFLAIPMIWLRMRALFRTQLSTTLERRLIWSAVALSIGGTTMVEVPFLVHLAGTSAWQRLSVLSLGFGIMVASSIALFIRRRHISPTQACLVGMDSAYLANATLCLIVYSFATGSLWSRSGWLVSRLIVWPIALELVWLSSRTFRLQTANSSPAASLVSNS